MTCLRHSKVLINSNSFTCRSISVTSLILREEINIGSLKGKYHFEEGRSHSEQTHRGKYQTFIHIYVFRILYANFKSSMIWVSLTRNRTRRSISSSNKTRECCLNFRRSSHLLPLTINNSFSKEALITMAEMIQWLSDYLLQ